LLSVFVSFEAQFSVAASDTYALPITLAFALFVQLADELPRLPH
jgi:hypothetical protein